MGCRQSIIPEGQFIFRMKNEHMWKNHLQQAQISQLKQRVQEIQQQIAAESCKLCSNKIIKKGTWQQNNNPKGINGRGVIYKRMKDFYFGQIQNGEAHGSGIILRSDKSVYKGRFENDKANGKGKVYIQETRFIFEGEWSEGIMSSGKFILTGIRIKSKEDNKYEIIFPNGSTYEGQAILNQQQIVLDGFGTLVNQRQDYRYMGNWKNNLKQGKGTAFFNKKGHQFEGQFKNNLKNGKGKYIFSETEYLEGTWKDDRIEKGVYYENDQQVEKFPSQSEILF